MNRGIWVCRRRLCNLGIISRLLEMALSGSGIATAQPPHYLVISDALYHYSVLPAENVPNGRSDSRVSSRRQPHGSRADQHQLAYRMFGRSMPDLSSKRFSLGYFINPLLSVLMGVFFRERLRPWRWVPLGWRRRGVLYPTFAYGSRHGLHLTLAFSFGIYGIVKKTTALGSFLRPDPGDPASCFCRRRYICFMPR